ncbi:MBL fold metallo-hydrolase [Dyella tabacisoli]|uniref:MBL fold metallo-hydrolase n=1 Tax=Dyella tabacisoli TaxID=2282381 RepID=A0A369USQ3_9GAMM|nr:MBL fold metallo-hydrolase [Dyella tabacisoli]RDD81369.1 MBL fold metallo-hydrolase [Dyella tabacisoli]
MSEQVYLKNMTKLEPLSGRWYAWSHLISPVQHSMNVAFRHLPIFQSFVTNAAIHEAAAKNPKMLGGSFMELKKTDLPSVKELLQETQDKCGHLIRFAEDLVNLDRQLQGETGFSLDHVYENLKPSLAGLVEVSYDMNNHASVRVLEELAYRGGLCNQATQELSFAQIRDEERNFFLNTPRLASAARIILSMPFTDPRIDLVAKARIAPTSFDELVDALEIRPEQREQFRDYFTTDAPTRKEPEYQGDGVRVRYFGHACVLVQTDQMSVLIDPFLTWDDDHDAEHHLCFNDLPDRIDYVFLTHNHQDHFSPELLLQLRQRIGRILVPRNNPNNVADPSMRLALKALGFHNVDALDWMDTVDIPGGAITSIPFYGEHADLNIASKHGMHLRVKDRSFLFLADSDCKDRALYQRIVAKLGKVDTLFIGMECDGAPLTWLYGSYLSNPINRKDDGSRRLSGSNASRASAIAEEFGCATAYVYAMGQEPWMRFVAGLQYTPQSKQIVESDKFVQDCRDAGLVAERLLGCRTLMF